MLDNIIHDHRASKIHIGPDYAPPTRYLFWAYHIGEATYEEALDILINKYKYGQEGAKNALAFVKEYPHLVHKPRDYEEKMYGSEQSL